jgi:hypothetical protein
VTIETRGKVPSDWQERSTGRIAQELKSRTGITLGMRLPGLHVSCRFRSLL